MKGAATMRKTKEQYIEEIMKYVDKMSLEQREKFLAYLRSIQPDKRLPAKTDKKSCCGDCQCKNGDDLCEHHAVP